jgi:Cu-processing system ATP-binding protein
MIRIRDLQKSYGKLLVLKGINLDLEEGKIITLMGPNGSGKTTLLKSILGLVLPEEGSIEVNGISTKNNFQYRELIGYMPQTAYFPNNLKVKEVISIIKDIRGSDKATDLELMELFKINQISDKTISSLSQGTKQRVSGAISFMFDSEITILDEPTAGLDPASAVFMKRKIIKERDKGKLIVISTHIINEVEELADRVIFILEGKINLDRNIDRKSHKKNGTDISNSVTKLFENYDWE